MASRIDQISDKDKLWELYLHTLTGFHENIGANERSYASIIEEALIAAKAALSEWKRNGDN